jgi:hypothetical protein
MPSGRPRPSLYAGRLLGRLPSSVAGKGGAGPHPAHHSRRPPRVQQQVPPPRQQQLARLSVPHGKDAGVEGAAPAVAGDVPAPWLHVAGLPGIFELQRKRHQLAAARDMPLKQRGRACKRHKDQPPVCHRKDWAAGDRSRVRSAPPASVSSTVVPPPAAAAVHVPITC